MTNTETQTMQARCDRGHGPCRINFQFDKNVKTLSLPARRMDGTITMEEFPIKEAAPRIVWCLEHKSMMHFRKLQTKLSTDACGQYCQTATGDKCKCSCGGLNHGVSA